MTMKRSREEEEEEDREIETLAMAKYLVLLNHINQTSTSTTSSLDRVFKCKTCGRKFRSFQALGGHRASHKRPKSSISSLPSSSIKIKAKMHECSICGLEFEMGQALGGHMRRHRADMINKEHNTRVVPASASVLKRSDSKRANLWLDLNLTPYENDLKLGYQIMAPLFTHFF